MRQSFTSSQCLLLDHTWNAFVFHAFPASGNKRQHAASENCKRLFILFSNWNFWITFVVYASSIVQTFYLFVVVFLNQTEGLITDCSGDVTLWSRPYTCQFSIKHVYDINTETTVSHVSPHPSLHWNNHRGKKKMKKEHVSDLHWKPN